jgi:hypothetical protein
MTDKDVFVFRVTRGRKNDTYSLEKNDKLSDGVIDKYNKSIGAGKNLKRSSGMKGAFNTVKKVASKTIWFVKFIIAIVILLMGILVLAIGIMESMSEVWIPGLAVTVIGIILVIIRWKKRHLS